MWTKVCGVIDADNAAAVADCGVDAIGLNFFRRSKRFIGDQARSVRDAIGSDAAAIGLFVNETATTIQYACERFSLDAVQLHGDEPASLVAELAPIPVYRAVRVPNGQIAKTVRDVLDGIGDVENLAGVLLDAHSTAGLGGTGESIDWHEVGGLSRENWPPLVLAGGLTPTNVAEAVTTAHPWGVDVASGVESSPGFKDVEAVRTFVTAARSAGE